MAKNKLIYIASVALIAIGAVVYFLTQKPDTAGNRFLSYISSEGLQSIVIEKDKEIVTLANDEGLSQWTVKAGDSPALIADASRIVRVLDNLNEAKVLQQVTKKEEHYERFDLTGEKAAKITVKRDGKEDLVLFLGKEKDYSSQFVRKAEDPKVYLISHKFNLQTTLDHWMHRKLKLEKNDLKNLSYKTKDNKKLHLIYDPSKNDFRLDGEAPKKKKLRNLATLANQFTEIQLKGIEEADKAPKGKTVTRHAITLKDDTEMDMKFIEAEKNKSKRYFLELDVKAKTDTLSPEIGYLASLSKNYLFELNNIPPHTFQKKWDEFFETVKEEPQKAEKK